MSKNPDTTLQKLNNIVNLINDILHYDPQLVFDDTFSRIHTQLTATEDLILTINTSEPNYWVVYNIFVAMIPIAERLIFAGYSDQILEFLLSLYHAISSNLMFSTSKYVPLKMQIFAAICSAYANTKESHEKDADLFIQTFKSEIMALKQLEEGNVNGLSEKIVTCTKQETTLETLYTTAFSEIELMTVHFNSSDDIVLDTKLGSSRRNKRKAGKVQPKEEVQPQSVPQPQPHTIELIINAFNSPLPKSDYLNKFGSAIQSWVSPDCSLGPSLLHRLLFNFLKSGKVDGVETVAQALPDDQIVKLAVALSEENWVEVSTIMADIPKSEIASDFQFFNEIALKLWNRYAAGKITDQRVLKGMIHVLVLSPSPCPLQLSLATLHYCWYLDEQGEYNEAACQSEDALSCLETFRDYFAYRKTTRVLPQSNKIPNKPLDASFLLFEKWLECVHVDLLVIWIRSKLRYGLEMDTTKAQIRFMDELEETRKLKIHEEKMYGTLDAHQKLKFDTLLNRAFQPPAHSKDTENEILTRFKNNCAAKALTYLQMAFFRPKNAASLLEKARQALAEQDTYSLPANSPLIFVNRYEIGLIFPHNISDAKTIAVFGKETTGSTGLTLSNTALQGTGIKQDKIEPFLITKLKPNTLYSFAFGAFDSQGEIIDNLMEPFSISTCHSLSHDMVWNYLASASYQLKDMTTFDIALTKLLTRFTDIADAPADHQFHKEMNPFNRFSLKPTTLSEPAPILRSYASALLMAARLFRSRPLHAASFQRVALVISQVLKNQQMTLMICSEMFSVLQDLLSHTFHTQWVISPLLYIIDALKTNKETAKDPVHQEITAKAAFILDSIFTTLYQERQLSLFVMSAVSLTPVNKFRSSFLLFASKNLLLESNPNDSTLPLYAAEMFRSSPERCFDELLSKFKQDPLFPSAAVYLVGAAHNTGMVNQGSNWATQALDYLKTVLQENEEKSQAKKSNARSNSKASQKKKTPPPKGKNKEQAKAPPPEETEAETAAALKITTVWNRYQSRRKNIIKFDSLNKYRAALNLLLAMCMMETDNTLAAAASQMTERTSRSARKHGKSTKSRHTKDKKAGGGEDESKADDTSLPVITALKRAIVLADRVQDEQIMRAAVSFTRVFLNTITPASSSYSSVIQSFSSIVNVFIDYMPVGEMWAQSLLQDCLLFLLTDNQFDNMTHLLVKAVQINPNCGSMIWILSETTIPPELLQIQQIVQKRDPAENLFFAADAALQKTMPSNVPLFPHDPGNIDINNLVKNVGEIAISLQHKQKLSMSVSLLTRIAFSLFSRNKNQQAVQKLCEALECHFRVVRAHEKIDAIIQNETEESFYQKHSWSGCVSIFVIASLIALHSERNKAMYLSKLAAFSIAALFTASPYNPKKEVDFADFEPPEIVPGIDLFSMFDPQQPLLEPVACEFVSIAINHLISSLTSFEMYFELFKPLAFAKHFFRFIVREKRGLARARLATVMTCAQFGLLGPAVQIMNNISTCYSQPRVTSENQLYPSTIKRTIFEIQEPPGSSGNLDAVKQLISSSTISAIQQNYGQAITSLFALCAARLFAVMAENSDPCGSQAEVAPTTRTHSSHGKHKKSHHSKGKDESGGGGSSSSMSISSIEFRDTCLKCAEQILNEQIGKDYRAEQQTIKAELQIELASIYMMQWRWESAIQMCNNVSKSINSQQDSPTMSTSIDKSILHEVGLKSRTTQIISQASYNMHDFSTANQLGSPYLKALIMIHKADYEGAAVLLAQIASSTQITRYYPEFILASAQLVLLFCYNRKLMEPALGKLNIDLKARLQPLELITKLNENTNKFFVEELGMNLERNFYLRGTHVLVRLKHLEALTNVNFNGQANPIELLAEAQHLMSHKCPFSTHGLNFQLTASVSRIQMKNFLSQSPTLIQFWNQEVNPLKVDNNISPEFIDKMTQLLQTMFSQAPDCVVHPSSQQSILDLSILSGISSQEPEKRLQQSLMTLSVASAVRSSKRFIQSLISQCSDSAPLNCPPMLMNDNKDQTLRGIAAAYYAHVCSLELPLFDTELLELRTYFFFKCFEEQCVSFKFLQKGNEQMTVDAGSVIGQWYQIDAEIFKNDTSNETTTVTGGRSSMSFSQSTNTRTSSSTANGKNKQQAMLKGSLFFYIGIVIDFDDASKKKPAKGAPPAPSSDAGKMIPIMLAAQLNDLKGVCDEMAEIGIEIEEANRMENSDTSGEPHAGKEQQDTGKSKGKRGSKPAKTESAHSTSLLKNQAATTLKNAELKWSVSIHKAETVFNKSNRIVGYLVENRNRWPTEVKMQGIEMSSATALSHFFNTQYGINEKAPQLAEWLATICATSMPSQRA